MFGKICVVQLTAQDVDVSALPPSSGFDPPDDALPALLDEPPVLLELAELPGGTGRSFPSRPSAGP
jgi:hypothetical protein